MLAFATSSKIRAETNEKSHVFWDVDFDGILGGFGKGFGRALGTHFHDFGSLLGSKDQFGHFLGTIFASIFRTPKNIEKWRGWSATPSL
mgnify:CR=1 FL=1